MTIKKTVVESICWNSWRTQQNDFIERISTRYWINDAGPFQYGAAQRDITIGLLKAEKPKEERARHIEALREELNRL